MISASRHLRPPRRFCGFGGVVRRLRRREVDGDEARQRLRSRTTENDRALQSERARFAAKLDVELRLACRSEAAMRRELGDAARAFMRVRSYKRLGFVRLSDYARERLGVSARTLQDAAWLVTRLDALPAISTAYDRSELSWAAARAICKVAVAGTEEQWLAVARRSTVETLERLVARTHRPDAVPPDPEGEPNEIDGDPAIRWRFVCPSRIRALWRRALELASRAAGEPLSDWRAAEIVAAEGSSGRPRGSSMGDRVLLEALRLARRDRRRRAAASAAVDVAGSGACPESAESLDGPEPQPFTRAGADTRSDAASSTAPAEQPPTRYDVPAGEPTPVSSDALAAEPLPAPFDAPAAEPAASSNPVSLDARLSEAIRVLRTIEPRIGRLLRVVVDQRIYRWFGHSAIEDYVRERLGISKRKAWALLEIEKATARSADFDRAYRDGTLSWVRALSLLPVLDRATAPAWIARAESVTVRRLCDEVEWVLASRDALGPSSSLAPPRVDSPLPSPIVMTPPSSGATSNAGATPTTASKECRDLSPHARLQIRAHDESPAMLSAGLRQNALDIVDAEIRFTGPASVVALLRDVLDAFADPDQPRWTALERLLRHVITHWESTPRHPDPVFARDGWRCTVPACSSRRNLHDHHIRFRSRGGDNQRDNRTTVCAAHHLHGIHRGTIRAFGVAPHAIEWQLGVRPGGAPPFLRYVGDRLCDPATSDSRTHRTLTTGWLASVF